MLPNPEEPDRPQLSDLKCCTSPGEVSPELHQGKRQEPASRFCAEGGWGSVGGGGTEVGLSGNPPPTHPPSFFCRSSFFFPGTWPPEPLVEEGNVLWGCWVWSQGIRDRKVPFKTKRIHEGLPRPSAQMCLSNFLTTSHS